MEYQKNVVDYILLRGIDETEVDVGDQEEKDKRSLLVDEIMESMPEVGLFRMIAKYIHLASPSPALVFLGARIGGMMKLLREASLDELVEYRDQVHARRGV